jgi:cullin 1
MFTRKEYMQFYTSVYDLSTTQVEHFQSELYKRYTDSIRDYLTRDVLPRLEGLSGGPLLVELELRWGNHQVMTRWMQRFF